jgi:hypothetical protein
MGPRDRRPEPDLSPLEATLDSLLAPAADKQKTQQGDKEPQPEVSPLDQIRETFGECLLPLVDKINARYADKEISVSLDASDFLNGGRGVLIEIEYRDHRIRLEGTAMPDAIAFQEMRYVSDLGGTVVAGPMLRRRHLTEEGFSDFIYQRVIALVKAANKTA